MIDNTSMGGRWIGWRLVVAIVSALLLALLLGVQTSHAQSGGDICLREATGFTQPNICTSNDVRIVEIAKETGPLSCEAGEKISVTLKVRLQSGAKARSDIGLYIAEDGGNAMDLGGVCFRDYLHPVSADNKDLDLTTGDGPFFNREFRADPTDTCGDIDGDDQDTYYILGPVSLTCSDADGNLMVDLGTVVSWDNKKDSTCLTEQDAVPNNTAKCRSQTIQVAGIVVEPSTATLEVRKVVEPQDESLFNLLIDGDSYATGVGHGGTTDPVVVSASDVEVGDLHTVGETASLGTSLSDYDTRIHCVDEDGDEFSANDAGPLSVYLQPLDVMTCTITNTRRGAGIKIAKVTNPEDQGASFEFTNSFGAPTEYLSHGEFKVYDEELELELGSVYTFTEVVPEGWELASIECYGDTEITIAEPSVAILYGGQERIDCTFTNEPLVSLKVTKTADPTSVYEPGDWVDFKVKVKNNGPVLLTLTSLSDDVYGDVADASNPELDSTNCSLPQPLGPGDSYTCRFEGEVTGVVGDEQTDTVTATAMDVAGGEITAQDQATVLILGEPPETGIGLATSVVVAGLAAVGGALLALGLLMRRRKPRTR